MNSGRAVEVSRNNCARGYQTDSDFWIGERECDAHSEYYMDYKILLLEFSATDPKESHNFKNFKIAFG